ncbi:MAG: hypothetical protein HOO96_28820 [Polyangiaceae bacterium]|nr:hypothetical protein [Polyangiaceae bacterium]
MRTPSARSPRASSALPLAFAVLVACSGDSASPGPAADVAPVSDAGGSSRAPGLDAGAAVDGKAPGKVDAAAPRPGIFTVLFENHDYDEVVGSPDAPFFNELIAKYGLATNYSDCNIHPSLPNYLCLISGDPQYPGLVDLNPTQAFPGGGFPVDKANLGTQLQAAGIPWGSYQESMGTACRLTAAAPYAPKHDPFLYFKDMQLGPGGLCAATNVDYAAFEADLAAGKNRYAFITPNLRSDGHDPTTDPVAGLRASDAWARTEIGKIMKSEAYLRGGTIFITWDEAEGRSGRSKDQVPMIVVSESIVSAGFKSAKPYSHKSYLATVETLLGLPRLATVATEPTLMEFFK